MNSDFRVYIEGGFQAHGSSHRPMYCASRPLSLVIAGRTEGIEFPVTRTARRRNDASAAAADATAQPAASVATP